MNEADNMTMAAGRKTSAEEDFPVREKTGAATISQSSTNENGQSSELVMSDNLFDPFPTGDMPQEEDETNILRIRSILLGAILGGIVNAANVYLGLKTGITFPANLFGSILGFAIIKTLSSLVPESFPILGGKFGPKENTIIQTSATAAGGLSNMFVSAVPALYQMQLLQVPSADYAKIVTFTLGTAYVGFFLATPMRNFFIIKVAKQLKLVFPTATATATTIRSMHLASAGEKRTMKKVKFLLHVFAAALVFRVASSFAVGILWDWHIFTWFFIWGKHNNSAILVENWGWFVEWSPAVIGTGLMVGSNTALSMFAEQSAAGPSSVPSWCGTVLPKVLSLGTWGAMGEAYNIFQYEYEGSGQQPQPALLASLALTSSSGVLLMVVVSIVELLCQYRSFIKVSSTVTSLFGSLSCASLQGLVKKPTSDAELSRNEQDEPISAHHHIQSWMWLLGLLVATIVTCISCGVQWGMSVGMTLVSIILAGIFTLLAILSTGTTDMTPLTAVSKSSQLIMGTLNSIGGAISAGIANQATDLTMDFRVGTPVRTQWIAQGIASLVAIFLAPGIFIVFVTAYPCVIDLTAESCPFSAPSVSAWRAATIAATSPKLPIPKSSGIFAICLAVFGALVVVFKNVWLTGVREKYRVYVPNLMAFGLMMVIPSPAIGIAVLIGASISFVWQKYKPQNHSDYMLSIVAGCIAGEGIGGVVNAIIAIAGVTAGTSLGCPAGSC
ncbi:OPT oligopeptide transporter [Colletotrichum tofieldiae]|nr:OPT oligopeptide transporter [Colletotrichum tofieldiae]